MNRRQAFGRFGTISAGALLTACGVDNDPTSATATATATPSPATTARTASGPLAARFDAAGSCAQTAEQTEGPYYLELDRVRTDITEDREGAALRIGIRVRDADGCEPIPNAAVEIWHCDATGLYSGFEAQSTGTGSGTDANTYLRGSQVTNDEGIAQFRTIYPGWYPGRTPHIHAKVLLDGSSALTTQLYFDDAVSDRVYAQAPYNAGRDVGNDADGIFSEDLILTLEPEGEGWLGLITFDVAAP